jgi:hypothetical protein
MMAHKCDLENPGGHSTGLAHDGEQNYSSESFNEVVISQGSVLPAHTYVQENR